MMTSGKQPKHTVPKYGQSCQVRQKPHWLDKIMKDLEHCLDDTYDIHKAEKLLHLENDWKAVMAAAMPKS